MPARMPVSVLRIVISSLVRSLVIISGADFEYGILPTLPIAASRNPGPPKPAMDRSGHVPAGSLASSGITNAKGPSSGFFPSTQALQHCQAQEKRFNFICFTRRSRKSAAARREVERLQHLPNPQSGLASWMDAGPISSFLLAAIIVVCGGADKGRRGPFRDGPGGVTAQRPDRAGLPVRHRVDVRRACQYDTRDSKEKQCRHRWWVAQGSRHEAHPCRRHCRHQG